MSVPRRVLVVEDDPAVALTVLAALEAEGFEVTEAGSAERAMDLLAAADFPVVLTDIYLDRQTGIDVLHRARALNPDGAVILMTGKGSLDTVIEATRGGAFDYLSKPFSVDRLMEAVRGAHRAAAEAAARSGAPEGPSAAAAAGDEEARGPMVGNSSPMVEVYKFISRVAPTDTTVLLRGETGTGKELVARSIHEHGPRGQGRLVVVDCAALPPTLLESELFGAVRGAYTGADRDRPGLLEAAAGGTAFLDEIGEIEPAFQLRLLRFLQEKEIRAVGSTTSRKVDVRVIAATNKDLRPLVASGRFREDLWYRLSVAMIELPPLRERRGDIPALVDRFLREFVTAHGRQVRLDAAALRLLADYDWPGNVRQLRHVLERMVILTPGSVVEAAATGAALEAYTVPHTAASASPAGFPPGVAAPANLDALEESHIRKVLDATGGNKSRAAAILGIERKTLYRKLEKMRQPR